MSNTNTGDKNTGCWNTGDWNTGYKNTGDKNTGANNTGANNTGDWNTGYCNTGYCNTGCWNTGDWNTGDWNTGSWNTCDYETGAFNTEQSNKIRVFNVEMPREDWVNANKPDFLYFDLTKWIRSEDMTDAEKEDFGSYKTTGGYLKVYGYKEAFQKSYNNATQEDKELLLKLPNFDADVFFEISGIDVREPDNSDKIKELKQAQKDLIAKAEEIQKQIEGLK